MKRNSTQTKEKLINAIQEILLEEGYGGLGVNKLAKKAGVDKRLIYRYFGSYNNLLEQFILKKDYWINIVDNVDNVLTKSKSLSLQEIVFFYLEKQMSIFYHDKVLQQLTLWHLNEPNHPVFLKINEIREKTSSHVLRKMSLRFEKSNINFRSIIAVLIGGICYISLSAQSHKIAFCEIDLNDELGQMEIRKAIRLITEWSFSGVRNEQE
ncbi:TetR/AcrR family transcriptional regulator [Parapedobacter sp. GCM10030251]|uniref:TetR/AcrR family transcriptional regulator n=1 Tax=Parapedobacter sp. GCM10030251 TaxID=3273419 RepID=UPI00361D2F7A